jgi:aubergine-like protein
MQDQPKREKFEYKYPKKPKRDSGKDSSYRKTKVICNLKQITLGEQNKKVQQYAIHFDPPISEDNYPLKRKIIKSLRKDLQGKFEKYAQAGDTIFVFSKDPDEKVSLETKIDDTLYKIIFERTSNEINCRNINTRTYDNIKVKSFIENIIKNIFMANNHMVRFDNRSFYDYKNAIEFGSSRTKIWSGYATAVTITENGLFLRVNDKNKLITGKTAYSKMLEIGKRFGNMRSEDSQREIMEYFKGRTVIATYGNYRAYRIGEISFDKNVKNTDFEMEKNGQKTRISIKNYYKQQYKIDIKDDDQPLLVEAIPKRKNNDNDNPQTIRYLIPELVYLTGIDELNERDRAEIIAKSKFQPNEKVKKIEKGFSYLNNEEKKKINKKDSSVELRSPNDIRMEWGINIVENFVEVEAHCLPIPKLEFGDKEEVPLIRNGRFRQQKDLKPIKFDKDNCMLITFKHLKDLAQNDCHQMEQAGKNLGVSFSRPKLEQIYSTRKSEELLQELKKINYNDGKEIAIVVLDKSTKSLYPFIKDYLYTQAGLTSQFMLHDENPRGGRKKQNLSYYSAVLNQMVVKSKGELFRINFSEKMTKQPSMIIGIDSTKTKDGMKYVLSASFNKSFNKFYTDMKVDNEDHSALCELIKSALDHFKSSNRDFKPTSIIIYRQGGNEKQTEKLIRNELPKIVEMFSGKYENNYKPKLTIFSVNKKTDLKFFEKHNGGYRNIPSGTVIDNQVMSPGVFEFYLQCPEVDRGTGSPVHFLCLHNDNEELTVNDFEEITYKQSFYYWNWSGPIRVPAALKYAEVANTFCGKNIKGEIINKLKDSPYFI